MADRAGSIALVFQDGGQLAMCLRVAGLNLQRLIQVIGRLVQSPLQRQRFGQQCLQIGIARFQGCCRRVLLRRFINLASREEYCSQKGMRRGPFHI